MARRYLRCSGFSWAWGPLFAVAAATHTAATAAPVASARNAGDPRGGAVPAVLVFAAASLSDVLEEIDRAYAAKTGTDVRAAYASSSVLAKQIESGAPADVFVAADREWMDYLDERGLLKRGSRHDLLGNTLVLIAGADSTLQLKIAPGFDLPGSLPRARFSHAAALWCSRKAAGAEARRRGVPAGHEISRSANEDGMRTSFCRWLDGHLSIPGILR